MHLCLLSGALLRRCHKAGSLCQVILILEGSSTSLYCVYTLKVKKIGPVKLSGPQEHRQVEGASPQTVCASCTQRQGAAR